MTTPLDRSWRGYQALESLTAARQLRKSADIAISEAVISCRQAGWSWADIAHTLEADTKTVTARYRKQGIY